MLSLVIGNKNLSSWSLRPWVLLKHLGLEFREIVLALDTPEFASAIAAYSPTGCVPVLIADDVRIWDAVAIGDDWNEKAQYRGWPAQVAARGHAPALCAEMHSGFTAMRETWPMNTTGRNLNRPLLAPVARDVARIDEI